MTPAVAVVIPVYNRPEAVVRAVDSVLAQTFADFELVVVDDGSTDATPGVLAAYADPRITVITQPSRGVSAARNAGVANSCAPWVALLDSDDLWEPDKLKRQLAHAQDGNWRITQTNEIWVRNGRRINQGRRHQKFEGDVFEPSLELCLVSPSCVLFTRELFQQSGGFDEAMPACEDYDLWLRVSLDTPVGLLDEELSIKHGGHADQLSAMGCLDLYRVYALVKLLASGRLDDRRRKVVVEWTRKKGRVFADGLEKRGKTEQFELFWNLVCKAVDGECFSPSDILSLAGN